MIKNKYETVTHGDKTVELEKLLLIAEDIHDKYEYRSRMIDRYRIMQLTLVTIAIILGAWGITRGYLSTSVSTFINRDFLLIVESTILVYALVFEYIIRRRRYSLMPDLMALSELVELIRETEGVIAETENWSTLERAQFRIRLSRFTIGPSTRPIITSQPRPKPTPRNKKRAQPYS